MGILNRVGFYSFHYKYRNGEDDIVLLLPFKNPPAGCGRRPLEYLLHQRWFQSLEALASFTKV